jgi:hypothetical protein
VFERDALQCLRVHDGIEELAIVSALFFRLIHGGVRGFDQRLGVGAVLGEDADADGGGDVELASFDVERVADGFEDFLRDERGVLGVRELGEEQRELVAAEAGDGVAVAYARLQRRSTRPRRSFEIVETPAVWPTAACRCAERTRSMPRQSYLGFFEVFVMISPTVILRSAGDRRLPNAP